MFNKPLTSNVDDILKKVDYFRSLHHANHMLILPNAWDAATARLFEDEGFKAVATTSAGMMVSLGYEDGEYISKDEFISAIARIAEAVTVPLSVDLVSGFGDNEKQVVNMVKEVADKGVIGINIEDFEHASGLVPYLYLLSYSVPDQQSCVVHYDLQPRLPLLSSPLSAGQ